ncbi:S1 family peptidase [Brevibacterium sp. JSBI002]|uniref:S1 family peptidase n=1 Tax=Brevibacterium sp. JSBI002 TaxID=2886045 RepID=UPI00222F08B1|nr:S1 family peptidase [Brevibacterium sp. JSBI002]UZD63497.1 S1 family peptidase [Brevibacterium sp. JSBI002]
MQKKLVQSSLALAAATALGLGGALVSGPAMADTADLTQVTAQKAAKSISVVNAFGFDNGTLHLGVEDEADVDAAEIEKLQKKYGADNVVVSAGFPEVKAHAKNDLVGGAGYLLKSPSTGGTGACSTGFSGWDDSGKPVVLTAGHCAEDTSEAGEDLGSNSVVDTERPSTAPAAEGEGGEPAGIGSIGSWGYNKYGSPVDPGETEGAEGDIDFAVINVDESKYNVKTGVTDWSSAADDDLAAKLATDITKVGAHTEGSVQKAGRTTGLTEGQVIPREQAPFDYMSVSGRWVHGFAVESSMSDPFSAPGDSGGGVFQGDTAVGVISGGGPAEWDDGTPFQLGWVADLDHSLEQSGVKFNLEKPGEEPPGDDEAEADASAAADGEDADASSAAEGDDANASSAAEGDDAEASADADGAEADASTAADGKDDEADSDADGDEKPEAPQVDDQTVSEGGNITGKAAPNAEVNLTWKAAGDAQAGSAQAAPAEGSVTLKTDADGNFSTEAPGEAGEYAYSATVTANGQTSEATNFTVTVQAAEAERNLTVEPKEISASDFVKEDKGVQITAEGFEEGENVTLEVVAGPDNVEGITLEETANADGVVGFSIYGTSASNPEAYLGKYDLEVTGANDTADEDALTGSFQVVADEDGNGGGDDGDDNGNDDGNGDGGGSDLPRTGAELTGLAAGAGLLLVGGAAVVLTMRRKKNN